MYKNGSIIWNSDPIIGGVPMQLFGAQDINKDGTVDLMTTWYDPSSMLSIRAQQMWIFSWNGSAGSIINAVDTVSRRNHWCASRVFGYDGFSLIDMNGNGIMVLQSQIPNWDDSGDSTVFYSWNGSLYGNWPSTPSVAPETFLPANLLIVNLTAAVSPDSGRFRYSYRLTDSSSSEQSIDHFYLTDVRSVCLSLQPEHWDFIAWTDTPVVGWTAMPGFAQLNRPGQTNDSLALVCAGLPSIVSFFIQGQRLLPTALSTITPNDIRNDLFSNSIHGKTIVPNDPPSQLDGLDFIDTMQSYIIQSRLLGWITSQPIAEKYTTSYDSVKARLLRNDIASVRSKLQSVMQNAVTDSSSSLSSEAFALIYYNTQYLIAQLPAGPTTFTITASAGPNGTIIPLGDMAVSAGDSVRYRIIPNTGYHVSGVFIENADTSAGTDSTYTFRSVSANHLISAFFAIDQYQLTVNSLPQSGGTNHPNGSAMYDSNTVVSDTAVPNANYRFGHWSGDISTSDSFVNPINVTMNRAKNITANFVATVQDTVGTSPPGLSFSVDGNSPPSTQVYTWDLGSVHTLGTTRTQVGGTGRQFIWTGWSDAGDSIHSITASTSRSYTATFKTQFQFTSSSSPDTTKGITSAQGTAWFDSTYAVSDTAKPKACNHFVNWTGDTASSSNPITITLYINEHLTANFVVNVDTIIASAGWSGIISPSGTVAVNCGSNQQFTVTPNSCYRIDSVIVDGVKKDSTTSYTFTNVTSNHSIRAVFVVKKDTIMASVDDENQWGTISPSGKVIDTCRANQTFTFTPNTCYGVSQVVVDGVNMGSITTYTFTNIDSNHTIVVSFSRLSYWINAEAGSGGTISPSGKYGVSCGANQTFTITPNTGFNISNVVVDGVSQGAISTYTFYDVTSTHTISASFICIGYTITASAGAGGTISPSGNVHVCTGANQTFTIAANSGYTINNVVVDGVSKGAISTYTFLSVNSNHTISASFSGGGGGCQPPCCIDGPSGMDQLTLTDALGKQKTLLVRNALRPMAAGMTDNSIASQLSLGTLNASLQSGQTVQSIAPDQGSTAFTIVVTGATYPLTLRLTTNAQNNIQYWLVRSGQPNLQLTNSSSVQIGSSTNGIINIQPLATQPCQ